MKIREKIRIAIIASTLAMTLGLITGLAYSLAAGAFVFVATLIMVLSYRYPRTALWCFLLYLPFGGTVTYYLGAHPVLHLLKDLFYFPAIVGLLRQSEFRRQVLQWSKPLQVSLLTVLLVCTCTLVLVNGWQAIQGPNIESPILIGLVGMKVLLGYIPLIFCAPYLVRDRHDLTFFIRLHILLIVICCSLSLLQYGLLAGNFCAGSQGLSGLANDRASLEARCFIGGSLLYNPAKDLIRLPGTFVAPWQWAWFLISGTFLSYIGYISDSDRNWRIAGLVAIAYIFTSVVLSGQRLALALVPLIILTLTFFTKRRKLWIFLEVGLGGFLSLLLLANLIDLQQPLQSFIDRWNASPPHDFVTDQVVWTLEKQGIFGGGLGRATNAARFLGETQLVETYYAKLMYEIGVVGFIAVFVFLSGLVWMTFQTYRSLENPTLKNVGFCLWLYIVLISYNTFYYPLDVDPVAVYYWLVVGIVLQLPRLDTQKKRQPILPPQVFTHPPSQPQEVLSEQSSFEST